MSILLTIYLKFVKDGIYLIMRSRYITNEGIKYKYPVCDPLTACFSYIMESCNLTWVIMGFCNIKELWLSVILQISVILQFSVIAWTVDI